MMERTAAIMLRNHVFTYKGMKVLLNVAFDGDAGMNYSLRGSVPAALAAGVTGKYTEREPGQPNHYYATAQGGTAPYTYDFRLYKGDTVYNNSGWIADDNYRIDFTEAGTYTMTVKVQDAKGNKSDGVHCTPTVVSIPEPLPAEGGAV